MASNENAKRGFDHAVMADEIPKSLPAAFINSRLDDLGLKSAPFRVYCHICRRAGEVGEYWEAVDNCAAHCQLHPDTAKKAIKELLKWGLIQMTRWPSGGTKHYRVTKLEEWTPPRNECPGIQTGGGQNVTTSPPKPMAGSEAPKPPPTPPKGMPPKVIPVSYSHEGNPAKGEAPPKIAKVQGWQLIKDRKELRAQIRELNESSNPDAELLAGLKAQLGEINQQIRSRGAVWPATGARLTAETPTSHTPQETAKRFNIHVEKTPHEVEEMIKKLREVVNGKPA